MKTHQGTRAATSEGGPRESRCELWRHAVTVPVPDTRPRPHLPPPGRGLLQTRRCKAALGPLGTWWTPPQCPAESIDLESPQRGTFSPALALFRVCSQRGRRRRRQPPDAGSASRPVSPGQAAGVQQRDAQSRTVGSAGDTLCLGHHRGSRTADGGPGATGGGRAEPTAAGGRRERRSSHKPRGEKTGDSMAKRHQAGPTGIV